MSTVKALTKIRHGLGNGEELIFEEGDTIEGVTEATIQKLIEIGAAEVVKVRSSNGPTSTKVATKANKNADDEKTEADTKTETETKE